MPTGMAEDFDSQDVRVIGVDCKFLVQYCVLDLKKEKENSWKNSMIIF